MQLYSERARRPSTDRELWGIVDQALRWASPAGQYKTSTGQITNRTLAEFAGLDPHRQRGLIETYGLRLEPQPKKGREDFCQRREQAAREILFGALEGKPGPYTTTELRDLLRDVGFSARKLQDRLTFDGLQTGRGTADRLIRQFVGERAAADADYLGGPPQALAGRSLR